MNILEKTMDIVSELSYCWILVSKKYSVHPNINVKLFKYLKYIISMKWLSKIQLDSDEDSTPLDEIVSPNGKEFISYDNQEHSGVFFFSCHFFKHFEKSKSENKHTSE